MTPASPTPPDPQDLQGRIEDALWDYEPVRSSDVPIQMHIGQDGRVRVHGWVRSRVIKDMVGAIVSGVPGVAQVDNQLVADPDLQVKAAQALAEAPGLRSLAAGELIVRAHLGAVGLVGQVPDEATRHAAADAVGKTPGVRRVVDDLEVSQS
jgi:osmotically-inducible protein OsmY